MLIYPAMDLMGGACVRLAQGRFETATAYSSDPAEALRTFAAAGATWTHVVDLDGARDGAPRQHELIRRLAGGPVSLQVAGGFRDRDQVARMFDDGVGRVVIGSLAVEAPAPTADLLEEFGAERIVLAFDVRLIDGVPEVATRGWREDSGLGLWAAIARYPQARHLLVTDIGRDGMMTGPNLDLLAELGARFPGVAIQASGGVASIEDIAALAGTGAAGAIVGKALWEGRIGLAEAIDAGR